MSGSTRLEGGGDWWHMVFETPRVSFPVPMPGEPSAEREYHDHAARTFHETVDGTREPLDRYLASAAERFGLVRLDEPGVPLGLMAPLPHTAGITVRVVAPLEPAESRFLAMRVYRLFARCQWRGPGRDDGPFHLVRFADGTVEDHSGDPVGFRVLDLAGDAAAELVRRCAEVLQAAEAEGVVHADLAPEHIYLDEDGTMTITGFGRGPGDGFHQPENTPKPDWIGIQRRGLERLIDHWGAPKASDALDDWLAEQWGPPFETREPRGSWRIEARLLAGAIGVLRPCQRCGEPTVLGSYVSSVMDGRQRPTCRPCVERDGRRFTLGLRIGCVGLIALVVGAVIYALR